MVRSKGNVMEVDIFGGEAGKISENEKCDKGR